MRFVPHLRFENAATGNVNIYAVENPQKLRKLPILTRNILTYILLRIFQICNNNSADSHDCADRNQSSV